MVLPQTDFFKGSLQDIPKPETPQNTQTDPNAKVGEIVVEYIKIPDNNEITIGSQNESLGEYKFKIINEPIVVEAITFEMEGDISKDNFANLKLQIAGQDIENAKYMWPEGDDKNSLFVDMSEKNYELQAGDTLLDLKGDITAGEADQRFAFHFVGADAKGKTTGTKIVTMGVNGSATPMPQIHILKAPNQ